MGVKGMREKRRIGGDRLGEREWGVVKIGKRVEGWGGI